MAEQSAAQVAPPAKATVADTGSPAAAAEPDAEPAAAAALAAAKPAAQPVTQAEAAGAAAGGPALNPGRLVQEGDNVILEVNRERHSFVHVKRGACVPVSLLPLLV